MSDPTTTAPGGSAGHRAPILLQAWFPAIVVAFTAVGCVMLLVEMLIGHHAQGERRIGIVVAILGVALSSASTFLVVAGIRLPAMARGVVVAAWAVLALGGLVGVWKHLDGENEGGGEATVSTLVSDSAPAYEAQSADAKRPPLAPLSFTGLGMLGGLAFLLATDPQAAHRRRGDTTA
jgi:hypothetical protein